MLQEYDSSEPGVLVALNWEMRFPPPAPPRLDLDSDCVSSFSLSAKDTLAPALALDAVEFDPPCTEDESAHVSPCWSGT